VNCHECTHIHFPDQAVVLGPDDRLVIKFSESPSMADVDSLFRRLDEVGLRDRTVVLGPGVLVTAVQLAPSGPEMVDGDTDDDDGDPTERDQEGPHA